jgi:hypothetical protein
MRIRVRRLLVVLAALAALSCGRGEPSADAGDEGPTPGGAEGGRTPGRARVPAVERVMADSRLQERGAPAEQHAVVTTDGAWSWPGDPRAITHVGERATTYVGWVDSRGDVRVASYDHATGEIVASTLAPGLDVDDHANPSLIVRPDGRLVAFYSAHSGAAMYCRVSSRPEDVTAWDDALTVPGNTAGPNGHTYPNPVFLRDEGRLYLFWRGGDFHPCFATSDDWVTWSGVTPFIAGEGRRPYVKVASDGARTIHVAFTDGHPMEEDRNSLYYVAYREGALFRADGSRVAAIEDLPIDPDAADLVYDANVSGVSSWVWDVAADPEGHPAIAYAVFPEGTDHRYRYARWDGARWRDHEITPAGAWFSGAYVPTGARLARATFLYYSGGLALDHEDPSVVYLSRPVAGTFEIERWATPDSGETWTAEPITSGSSANSVRPVVSRHHVEGGPTVVWMHGEYVDFKDYGTALRMW